MPSEPRPPAANDLLWVFVTRARCPVCRGSKLRTYRSSAGGDGSTTRHTSCRACGHKFRVVVEDAEG